MLENLHFFFRHLEMWPNFKRDWVNERIRNCLNLAASRRVTGQALSGRVKILKLLIWVSVFICSRTFSSIPVELVNWAHTCWCSWTHSLCILLAVNKDNVLILVPRIDISSDGSLDSFKRSLIFHWIYRKRLWLSGTGKEKIVEAWRQHWCLLMQNISD
jgi:hypothetical protein